MFSSLRWKYRRIFGALAIGTLGACTYELPNIDAGPGETGGAGGMHSASSSSGNGGQPAGSSSGKGGGPSTGSSSSGVMGSSSGFPGPSSSSGFSGSSSSSSGMMGGTVHCGDFDCFVVGGTVGCCYGGAGDLSCKDRTACSSYLFYCDGPEDCLNGGECCLDGQSASCGNNCTTTICNDPAQCPPVAPICDLTAFGTIGQCR